MKITSGALSAINLSNFYETFFLLTQLFISYLTHLGTQTHFRRTQHRKRKLVRQRLEKQRLEGTQANVYTK